MDGRSSYRPGWGTIAGQIAASALTAIGLPDLIAKTEDEYIEIAMRLGEDTERLVQLRSSMRQQVAESPVADPQTIRRRRRDIVSRFLDPVVRRSVTHQDGYLRRVQYMAGDTAEDHLADAASRIGALHQ